MYQAICNWGDCKKVSRSLSVGNTSKADSIRVLWAPGHWLGPGGPLPDLLDPFSVDEVPLPSPPGWLIVGCMTFFDIETGKWCFIGGAVLGIGGKCTPSWRKAKLLSGGALKPEVGMACGFIDAKPIAPLDGGVGFWGRGNGAGPRLGEELWGWPICCSIFWGEEALLRACFIKGVAADTAGPGGMNPVWGGGNDGCPGGGMPANAPGGNWGMGK